MPKSVVLITGGSGFLGQHIIKLLQEKEHEGVGEIRVIDLVPYQNTLGHEEPIPVVSVVADICDRNSIKAVFANVETVFHCAAFTTLEYPSPSDELERVNVQGTQCVIDLCKESDVKNLIYTSDLAINLLPFYSNAVFAVAVNLSETGSEVPKRKQDFFVRGYPYYKAQADKLVLEANGSLLGNQTDTLSTVSLRPTLMYGEGDKANFSKIFEFSHRWNGKIPRIAGDGGKHQLMYVGNAAWAHLCARRTLNKAPKNIAGLPVFLTDESPIYDITRFANILCRYTKTLKCSLSSWKVPMLFSYLIALMVLFVIDTLNRFGKNIKLQYDPKAIIGYHGSMVYWSRMRASIHMDYEPIFKPDTAMCSSALWYEDWHFKNIKTQR